MLFGQSWGVAVKLAVAYVTPYIAAGDFVFVHGENRLEVPGLCALFLLRLPAPGERSVEGFQEIRAFACDLVVDGDGTGDEAQASLLGGAHDEQPHDVAAVRMIGELLIGLVAASLRAHDVDADRCLAVDASGKFLGGLILPGHGIMLRALESGTAGLHVPTLHLEYLFS